jgi:hypothetical protein
MSIEAIIGIVLVCIIILFCLFRKKQTGQRGGGEGLGIGIVLMFFLLAFVTFIILGDLGQIKGLTFTKAIGAN